MAHLYAKSTYNYGKDKKLISNLVIDTLAAYRLTKLITEDEITADARQVILDKLDRSGRDKLVYLLTCPVCISVYTTAGTTAFRYLFPKTAKVVNSALAGAAILAIAYEKYL